MEELSGFIIIDKPKGPTSHDTCMMTRRIIGSDKVGHSGTLDPQVTGVLPIAIGKATKLIRYLKSDKEYVGIMHMHEEISENDLKKAVKDFIGKIKQTPPKRSAVKREEREREIYSFEIIEQKEKDFLFRVHCEAGTYIRKLVHDLGEKIGIGAHMLELRRIKAGDFKEKDSVNLYQLQEAVNEGKLSDYILPMEIIAKDMPKIDVREEFLKKIYNGSPIYGEYILKQDKLEKNNIVAVLCNKKLIEVAKVVLEENKIAVPETVIK